MRKWLGTGLLMMAVALYGAHRFIGHKTVASSKLVITGSSTAAPLVTEIAKRYETLEPAVRIDVQTGGSSRGIADAATGLAHIGMSSRALKASEKEGLQPYVLAQDGVCFLVHASNPVDTLTDEQLKAIYTGQVNNWKEVGGRDAPITVVNRAQGRSELELILDYFELAPDAIEADLVVGENQHGIKTVAGDPNAIVYMSVGTAEYEKNQGTPIKLLPLRGVAASSDTVAKGRFPLSRPLILIAQPEPEDGVRSFLKFALSTNVHGLIRSQAFVPVR